MKRFFVPTSQIREGHVTLFGADAHHAARVLRLLAGDRFIAVDGTGLEHTVEVASVSPRQVAGRILASTRPDREPRVRLGLLQALLKGEKMDLVLRQCTELGVAEFQLVKTRRVIARLPEERLNSRLARWREIVRSAAEQSGRVVLPSVLPPIPWEEAIAGAVAQAPCIVSYEGEAPPLRAVLGEISRPDQLFLALGPEGGFDGSEIAAACALGARAASLGRLTLRAETASVVAAAVVLYHVDGL